ncbi:MAG: hypothetical protein AB7Q37_03355 [Pyrinomonadaceae bacterium]
MISRDELKQIGQSYLEKFDEVDFVGEIEVTEAELDAYMPALWKAIFQTGMKDDLRALLTVVVVNLAYYSRDDFDTRSFRWLVLNRLSNSDLQDVRVWEEHIGSPVLNLLKHHFGAADVPGPNKYVRPILQQAGVSENTRPQFVTFFCQLINRLGFPFSQRDYRDFQTRHGVNSAVLQSFLDTDAGWRFCLEVARILRNIRLRLVGGDEAVELAPRFKDTLRVIQNRLRDIEPKKLSGSKIPFPRFTLDKQSNRLVALFSEKGFVGAGTAYRLADGTRIYQTAYPISKDDFEEGTLTGTVRQENSTDSWELSLWRPETDAWAAFDVSSGGFVQSEGMLQPGEYLMVLPEGYVLPNTREDCGYLDFPDENLYRVYHSVLERGYSHPELDIKVKEEGAEIPFLRFAAPPYPLQFTDNIFVGQLPKIEVVNWTAENASNYFIAIDDGKRKSRISANQITHQDRLNLALDSPVKAELSIEAVGKKSETSAAIPLSFTVLPKEFSIHWNDELYDNDAEPTLSFSPSNEVSMLWNDECLIFESPTQWRAVPRVSYLEMRVQYGNYVVFPLSIPVYRFLLHSDAIQDGLLWQSALERQANLTFSVSKNERRQNIEVGLLIGEAYFKVCDSKPVPDSLELVVTSDSIRDAFDDSRKITGTVAIKTRRGKTLGSSVRYINEKLIIEHAFDEEDEFQSWSAFLPDSLRRSISSVRDAVRRGGGERILPNFPVPLSLTEWINSFEPDFESLRQSVNTWAEACRREQWVKLAHLDLSQGEVGAKLTAAARTYFYGVEARRLGNLVKYNSSLVTAYRQLEIDDSDVIDLSTEIARCLRALCCHRLGKIDEMQVETERLGPRWKRVKMVIQNGGKYYVHGEENAKFFNPIDIAFHTDDLSYVLRENIEEKGAEC